MSTPKLLAGAALALAASAGISLASDVLSPGSDGFTKYGEVEGWNIYVDNERKTCLIEKIDDAENVVQMGLTADKQYGYLGVFSKGDTGVKKGKKSEIFIDIEGNLYSSEATGMKGNISEGYSGGYILANNPQFVEDIRKKHYMIVFPEKPGAFKVDLTGTYKAIEEARACNDAQGG